MAQVTDSKNNAENVCVTHLLADPRSGMYTQFTMQAGQSGNSQADFFSPEAELPSRSFDRNETDNDNCSPEWNQTFSPSLRNRMPKSKSSTKRHALKFKLRGAKVTGKQSHCHYAHAPMKMQNSIK